MEDNIKININKTFDLLNNSYSPYSKFKVASAVVTKKNNFYGGVNVENISYGLTMCAERSAIFNMITNLEDDDKIDYVIIVSNCTNKLFPCGACLQVFSEFLNKDTKIIISCSDKKINYFKLQDFLPNIFKI